MAKEFGIPRITLHDKITGRYAENAPLGRLTLLKLDEEKVISDWVIKFPVTKEQLLFSGAKLFKNLNRENPFSGEAPGEKWLSLFIQRHPEISERMSQALSTSRANLVILQ